MIDKVPEWYGRQLLAESLRAVGLPVVVDAFWQSPHTLMGYEERLDAIAAASRVLAEARRRLPAAVSGAVLDAGWRAMAWQATVAGLATVAGTLPSCEPAARKPAPSRPTPQPRPTPATGPTAPGRRVATPTPALAETASSGFSIRRGGARG